MKRILCSALFFIALFAIWRLVVAAKIWSVVLLPDPITT
jgi:ABC-type nitrate/sulfonate/bicarbonate transport system permease component